MISFKPNIPYEIQRPVLELSSNDPHKIAIALQVMSQFSDYFDFNFPELTRTVQHLATPQNKIYDLMLDILLKKMGGNQGEIIKQVIQTGDLKLLERVLRVPEDLNVRDLFGNTPLINAAYEGKKEMVSFLLAKGADPKLWSYSGLAIHNAIKRGFPEIVELLMPYEQDPFLPHFFMMQKMIAHWFGLKTHVITSCCSKVALEGFDEEYVFPEICKSLKAFIDDPTTSASDPEMRKIWIQVLTIMSKAVDNQKDIPKALNDPIAVIYVRFNDFTKRRGHSVGLIAAKSQNLLLKGNRGQGHQNRPGLTTHTVGHPEKMAAALQEMKSLRHHRDGEHFFKETLNQKLDLNEIGYNIHKEQKAGICTLASGKLDVRGVLSLLIRQVKPDEEKTLSRKLYKEWTRHARNKAVKTFCEAIDQLHSKHLKLTNEGIAYKGLLELILPKCMHKELVEGVNEITRRYSLKVQGMTPAVYALLYGKRDLLEAHTTKDTADLFKLYDLIHQKLRGVPIQFLGDFKEPLSQFHDLKAKATLYWGFSTAIFPALTQFMVEHFKTLPQEKQKELRSILVYDLQEAIEEGIYDEDDRLLKTHQDLIASL